MEDFKALCAPIMELFSPEQYMTMFTGCNTLSITNLSDSKLSSPYATVRLEEMKLSAFLGTGGRLIVSAEICNPNFDPEKFALRVANAVVTLRMTQLEVNVSSFLSNMRNSLTQAVNSIPIPHF